MKEINSNWVEGNKDGRMKKEGSEGGKTMFKESMEKSHNYKTLLCLTHMSSKLLPSLGYNNL